MFYLSDASFFFFPKAKDRTTAEKKQTKDNHNYSNKRLKLRVRPISAALIVPSDDEDVDYGDPFSRAAIKTRYTHHRVD